MIGMAIMSAFGMIAPRVLHLAGDRRHGVVAGVHPHADGEPVVQVAPQRLARDHERLERRPVPVGEPQDDQDDERRHDDDGEDHRADGDDVEAADVGVGEHGDQHGPDAPDLPRVELRPPRGDVALHQGDVDGRVDPLAGPRPPAALEPPELAHGAPRPGVVAALLGQRRAELRAHERHGQRPHDGQHEQQQQREPGAGAVAADHVLDAEGARGHEDEDHGHGGHERDPHPPELLCHVPPSLPTWAGTRSGGGTAASSRRPPLHPQIGSSSSGRQVHDAPRGAVLRHQLEERRRVDLLRCEDARAPAPGPWPA